MPCYNDFGGPYTQEDLERLADDQIAALRARVAEVEEQNMNNVACADLQIRELTDRAEARLSALASEHEAHSLELVKRNEALEKGLGECYAELCQHLPALELRPNNRYAALLERP